MQKQAPSLGRILSMVIFALSCFAILLFLWLSFGGPIPLKPQKYRLKASFPEATTLAEEADVRLAGVNVGRVKGKELEKRGARTLVTMELDSDFAPVPRDTKAILRQKTLLGETYVELTPGTRAERVGELPDGGRLRQANVEDTVEIDEIFRTFDEDTRDAFRLWVDELAKVTKDGRGEDLNDALGNLAPFLVDGSDVLGVLEDQETVVRRLIRNTGQVFGALNEREGELRELIVNSNEVFETTASRDDALAETFEVFPTFLDESRLTLARLEGFSRNTHPLVNDLKGPADDLGPTVRDLGDLAPDLRRLFRDLDPLIRASRTGLPDLRRILAEAEPLLEGLHVFLPELNPILSFANYQQEVLAGFLTNGGAALNGGILNRKAGQPPDSYLRLYGMINPQSAQLSSTTRPPYERGNAYLAPNALTRAKAFGVPESFDCAPAGGEKPNPTDNTVGADIPPCFVAPQQLFQDQKFPLLRKGNSPLVKPPDEFEGKEPASP